MQRAGAVRTTVDPHLVADFRADYADAFEIADPSDAPAAAWARDALRGAAVARGVFARGVWHGVLRFRLERLGTPGTLVGWRVTHDEPGRFVLDADGPLMSGRLVFAKTDGVLVWTTLLRHHRPAAARIWAVAGPVHRTLTPRCLDAAGAAMRRRVRQAR